MAGVGGGRLSKQVLKMKELTLRSLFKLSVSMLMLHGGLPGEIPLYAQSPRVLINSTPFILKSMPVLMTNYVVVFSITLVYKIFFLVFFLNVFNTPIQFCMPLQSWFSSSNPFTTLLSCLTVASGISSQCLRGLLSPTQSLLKNLLSAYCLHNAVLATGLCICLPSCQPLLEDPMAPSTSPAFSSPTHPSRLS